MSLSPAPTFPNQLEIRHIAELIPHRPPFLFVETATIVPDAPVPTIVGTFRVKHKTCAGHFPEHAIFPGVLWQEMANQLAGILLAHQAGRMADGRYVQTDWAKVTQEAQPGDLLTMRVQVNHQRMGFVKFQAEGQVNGQPAFTGGQVCAEKHT